jgi:methyl-accepting chemotaxis protein
MKFVYDLKLGQKLALVLLMLLVPIGYLTWQHVVTLQTQMRNDRLALDGLDYLEGLQKALVPVTRHQALTAAVLLGGAEPAKLDPVRAAADEGFATFAKAHAKYSAGGETAKLAEQLQVEWNAVRDGWMRMEPQTLWQRHEDLIAHMNVVMDRLGAEHMLNRGMDNTLMYVKQSVSQTLPDLKMALGRLRYAAIVLASTREPVQGANLFAVGGAQEALVAGFARLGDALDVAQTHPTLGGDFKALDDGPATEGRRALDKYDAWLQLGMSPGKPVTFSIDDVLEHGKPVVASVDALGDGFEKALRTAMEQRYADSVMRRNLGIAVVAILLAFALVLGVLLSRSVTAGMRRAVGAFERIEQGHFDDAIAAKSNDEVGQVLKGLARMQAQLKTQIENDRRIAAENGRVRSALDKVTTNVMLADADGKVIYMNEAVQAMFRANATEIRKQLPAFDPDTILGSNFDVFHRNPAHQRNLLGTLTQTHATEMKLGGATLKIVANPVVDAQGVRLGTAVQWFDRTQEVATEDEVKFVVQAANEGDMTKRIRRDGKTGFFLSLADGMNGLLDNMAEVVRTIKLAAAEVSTGSEEISKGNQNLSQRTEEQASSLEETASSMEEMTSTVRQNADNARQADQLASAARSQAERGGAVVAQAVAAMQEINASSKKIADIIGVIDEIAFQTNLLALNAAVEAARAGEQGRGFAVVASEVRNLASRSAEAAKEIKALIQDSVAKVTEGSKLVDESGQTLGEIVASVKKVTDIVAEISAASQEQSSGIEQVNKAVMSMDEVTQQNAALVEEAAAAAEALMQQAQSLTEMMAKYRLGDEDSNVIWSGHERRTGNPPPREAPVTRHGAALGVRPRPATARPAAAKPAARPAAARPRAVSGGAVAQAGQEWSEF